MMVSARGVIFGLTVSGLLAMGCDASHFADPVDAGGFDAGPPDAAFETAKLSPTEGANTVDLSVFSGVQSGATLAFTMDVIGGGLFFSGIELVNMSSVSVRIVHPRFVIWCPSPTPDVIDSFSMLDLTVAAASSQPVGDGSVSFAGAPSTCQLSISFDFIGSP